MNNVIFQGLLLLQNDHPPTKHAVSVNDFHRCTMCNYSTPHLRNMPKHVRTHTGERPYELPVLLSVSNRFLSCSIKDENIKSAVVPFSSVYRTQREPIFELNSSLRHLIGYNLLDETPLPNICFVDKPFVCHHCGKRFRFKGDMQRHTRIHTGEKPFKCNICMKSFRQSSHLNQHKIVHYRAAIQN
ncbi:zinc finger protein 471 [Caerostris extrusa]|uniref:Zinc finger protein 471 n=1 Tax=Caerostris extrusa TaxID=172846 RepID=A0AAV4MDC2_CAEEX|nr:zinc finger protein 471 [Caerostris extrusa]